MNTETLANLTAAEVRAVLSMKLMGGYPLISAPGGDPWIAELLIDAAGIRFWPEFVPGNRIRLDNGPIAAVDVTLKSDDIDLARTSTDDEDVWLDEEGNVIADLDAYDDENAALNWERHVEDHIDGWVSEIMEQVEAWLERHTKQEEAA